MSLDRFKQAQARGAPADFQTALEELRAGCKVSHWIWYVFPQLAGLGQSPTAQHYAIRDLNEARDYLLDPLLRERLLLATEAVATHLRRGALVRDIMGGTMDALKLVSSLTLFSHAARMLPDDASLDRDNLAARCDEVLALAEQQGFARCRFTERAVAAAQR